MDATIIYFFLIFGSLRETTAIVGYDCGSPHLNITTLSLLDVEECDIPLTQPQIQKKYIQLLQLAKFESIQVTQCKVSMARNIYYCGMHSHVSTVTNAHAEYILDTTAEQCKRMHQTNTFTISTNHIIYGLKINYTTSRPITLAGSTTSDGRCSGAYYADPYGSWDNVVVQGIATITLTTYEAPINLETNRIHLRSGVTCPYSSNTCIDIDGGHTFWPTIPTDYCKFGHYNVLYEGHANRMLDNSYEQPQIVYSLSTQDITFALTQTGEELLCGYTLFKTEHPKLFILETNKGETFTTRRQMLTENLDIFAYVNSKFIYVEKHIRTQLKYLYRDVLKQRCNLEQQVLKNALSIAIQSPDEFAYQLMKGPGYMATATGEVVYIMKCTPVEVKIRLLNECFSQLPVQKGNETFFLSPRTHILMKTGTQISCNKIIPPMYFLHDGWYRMIPSPEHTLPPAKIKPLTRPTWNYTNPGALATSGIYSTSDLEKLRDHIMFPAEKPGILNTMARVISGQPAVPQGISFSNLLDDHSLQKITENAWKKIWGQFTMFGNASAGLIGIYFCIRTIKLIIDTVVHGYALHGIYGWSIHLIGAVWDSITNLLIHLSHKPREQLNPPDEDTTQKMATSFEDSIPINATTVPTAPLTSSKTTSNFYPQL